jgi:hypothetical protein
LLSDSINEENKNGSSSMVNSVTEKPESKSTYVESNESKEASFIQQEHGKLSKIVVLDFSGCKGVYLLPYDFCVKEVDDHQAPKNIVKQCSVDREHQSEESRDSQQQEDKALENHQMAEQGIFRSYSYHALPTSSKRHIQQIIYFLSDWVKTYC